jgi:hypothetical protein
MNKLLPMLRTSMLVPLCALALVAACSNPVDLTETPQTFVDPANYFKTPAEAIDAANGMYIQLMSWDDWIDPAAQEITCEEPDVACASWWAWSTQGPGISGSFWFQGRTWTSNYAVIRRANDLLGQLQGSSLDPVLISRLQGEAHFLRGYAYFELVRRYGAVPLRLDAYKPDGTYGEIARSPVTDVYNAIVKDLRSASTELPANFSSKTYSDADRGRPIAASANGLLAKVYLHMAGKEAGVQGTAIYNDSARKAAQLVISDGNVGLESDYMKNFDWSTQINSKEDLWQIGATHRENTGPEIGNMFVPNDFTLIGGGAAGVQAQMRTAFYQTFEPGDLRVKPGYAIFDKWQDGSSSTSPGTTTYFSDAVPATVQAQMAAGTQTGWTWSDGGTCDTNGVNFFTVAGGTSVGKTPRAFTMKYVDRTALTKSQNSTNPVILRVADVMLVFAEAENEANGSPSAAAYSAINAVRARAGLSNLTPGLSQAQFRDAVWMERRHELFAEFQGWFDLKREGRYLNVINNTTPAYAATAKTPAAVTPNAPFCKTRQAYQQLLPLPDAEIGSNKLIKQNPGY